MSADAIAEQASEVDALTRVVDKATADYSRQLDLATEMLRDAGKSFDQTLITLAAGAVVLSVTYMRPAGRPPQSLVIAWISFGTALCLALLSFKLVQLPLFRDLKRFSLAIRRTERGLSQATLGNMDEAKASFVPTYSEQCLERSVRRWRVILGALNVVAVAAFAAGVISLLYFASTGILPAAKVIAR